MIRSAIEDWEDPSGSEFRCKSGNPGRNYGSSIDFGMKSRQPTGSTVRPDTEGQAFEETMNKAVRYQGTAFHSFSFN